MRQIATRQEHEPRRRVRWRAGLALGLGLSTMGLGVFYGANWSTLHRLPAIVQTKLRRHHAAWTPLNRVSPWFTNALIATEDRSFYRNWGISFQGIARAALVDLHTGEFTQGGSTITQQLIRDLMLSPAKTLSRKLSGVLLSLAATVLYTKPQLLTLYVNEVYLGDGAYGVGQASTRYFGIAASRLTLPEASLLAGLPQAPSLYNPLAHYRLAKVRQQEVLQSMVQDHMISEATARKAFAAALPLRRPTPKRRAG